MSSDQFFEQIKLKIKLGIEKRNLELGKIKKIINNYDKNLSVSLEKLSQNFKFYDKVKKYNQFDIFFNLIKNYLKYYYNLNEILIDNNFIEKFIKDVINLLISEKLCMKCYLSKIRDTYHPISEDHTIYYCENCNKKAKFFKKSQHLPTFLMYLKEWEINTNRQNLKNFNREFIEYLFTDCFNYFKDKGNLNSIILFYKILERNKIFHDIFKDKSLLRRILTDNLIKTIKRRDVYSFIEVKNFYNNEVGDISEFIKDHLDLILKEMVIDPLKSGAPYNILYTIERILEENHIDFSKILANKKIQQQIEKNFYEGLSRDLETKDFNSFRQLFNYSIKFDVFIDVKKIPNRFEHLSDLLLQSIQALGLGEVIEILRFYNKFNLFEKDFSEEDKRLLENIKKNKLFLSNLKDLFGGCSSSFILYVNKVMPQNLYDFFILNESDLISYYEDPEQIVAAVLAYLNNYSVYGLSVRKLGDLSRFIKKFEKAYEINKEENDSLYESFKFMRFSFTNKLQLVSPENISKNKDKILTENNYNFYSLSMVLRGGLGPQGLGFTYSTPKGEVIEICSDQKETEAIIVKYKQFLKQQFLAILEKELHNLHIDPDINQNIINYLTEVLNQNEIINYYKKGSILKRINILLNKDDVNQNEIINYYKELTLKQINKFLNKNQQYQHSYKKEIQQLMEKISNAISIILRPIKMIDQFKCRMELVAEDQIRSEDIARLTSLKEKSHYDVLRERLFFQYVVDLFYDIYKSKKSSIGR